MGNYHPVLEETPDLATSSERCCPFWLDAFVTAFIFTGVSFLCYVGEENPAQPTLNNPKITRNHLWLGVKDQNGLKQHSPE